MALVEQGADVTGIDVVPESIEVTRPRLRFFGWTSLRCIT